MKFTAQQIKFALIKDNNPLLEKCRVNKKDRAFQIWKRNQLSVELSSQKVFLQKLEYIHYNPVESGVTFRRCWCSPSLSIASTSTRRIWCYHQMLNHKALTNYMSKAWDFPLIYINKFHIN